MLKILLIQPSYYSVYYNYAKLAKADICYPPMGLLYLAGQLLRQKHTVKFLDLSVNDINLEELIEIIQAFNPDLIGITAVTATFHVASKLAKDIKKSFNVKIVIGGNHISILKDREFQNHPEFDYAILGEGEISFTNLIQAIENDSNLATVKGLIFRKNNQIIINDPQPLINKLDDLAFPARELTQIDDYTVIPPNSKNRIPLVAFLTKRGCPYKCNFCSQQSIFSNTVRFRDMSCILEEVEIIAKRYHQFHLKIIDDNLVLKRSRMLAFCKGIKDRNLKFSWDGVTRVDLIKKDLLEIMVDAGLTGIAFGIESGDELILHNTCKKITHDQIRQAFKWAKEAGVAETMGSSIIGHPNETKKTAWKTIKFLSSIKHLDKTNFGAMVPYPGTKVFELAEKGEAGYRLLTKDFSKYSPYENEVLEVNDLTTTELKRIQVLGNLYFYLCSPSRLFKILMVRGLKIGISLSFLLLKSIVYSFFVNKKRNK